MYIILDLRASKEIVIRPNNDKTHNMTVRFDVFESDGIIHKCEAECYYPKVNIKNLDIEALVFADDSYGKIFIKDDQNG